ncbi:cytochrome c peroxidase [Flammeovirgaceae bacterium SG7u.111]|nr:cytochrome c peroxidase [Flammeovirgaceae bacterium SG7u.132]WPO34077.1 cytochrome c peroxidase [Flammeovirgaceae bacterium SG7u.111]
MGKHTRLSLIVKISQVIFILLLPALYQSGCTPKKTATIVPPPYFADSIPYPARNPFSPEGITLGKQLFFDPALSANGRISCATCHQPQRAFSDGLPLSNLGSSQETLARHTPALINLAWNKGLFWDGGVKNLESVLFAPLSHPDEMALPLKELVTKLKNDPTYPEQFREVFGNSIQVAYVARALAQYQRSLISANAKYDQVVLGKEGVEFLALEKKGLALFEEKCISCHPAPFFTDHGFHNIGLDSLYPTERENPLQGRYRITLDSADLGKFKTPTLRNITLTAPYMHDGRFATLEEVLDHYSEEMKQSKTLDSTFLDKNGKIGIGLDEKEKEALLSFLHTLTDSGFVNQY